MNFVVDRSNTGTPALNWERSRRWRSARAISLRVPARVIVVAPHPDDEVLGAGGLLQHFNDQGAQIIVVSVTDGEASHPNTPGTTIDIRSIRRAECDIALRRLGIRNWTLIRLQIPDGEVSDKIPRVETELSKILRPGDLCLSPWVDDGHPDHDASGVAARMASGNANCNLLFYLVWALHWAGPDNEDLPWLSCREYSLRHNELRRKRLATLAFRSQIRPFRSSRAEPVLPPEVLRRHWLDRELFIDPQATMLNRLSEAGLDKEADE